MIRKILVLLLIISWAIVLIPRINKRIYQPKEAALLKSEFVKSPVSLKEARELLRVRKDKEAMFAFQQALIVQPENTQALWGEAEVLRRKGSLKDSEVILSRVLENDPGYNPALISLAYIKNKAGNPAEALALVNKVLQNQNKSREDEALALVILGSINRQRSSQGWIFDKIRFGTKIKGSLLKAKELAPELPEAHFALGSFYLLAPSIIGGDLDKAIEELELAVEIAPGFASANARLAQAYRRKGIASKYDYFLKQAKELEPDNEVLKELEIDK